MKNILNEINKIQDIKLKMEQQYYMNLLEKMNTLQDENFKKYIYPYLKEVKSTEDWIDRNKFVEHWIQSPESQFIVSMPAQQPVLPPPQIPQQPLISIITWNIDNKFDVKNELNLYLTIKADIYCFQEVDPNIDVANWAGYHAVKLLYDFVDTQNPPQDKTAKLCLLILVDSNKFDIQSVNFLDKNNMFAEDSQKSNQKFTRYYICTIKDKITNKIYNIINTHLKGGPAGYANKRKLINNMLQFYNQHNPNNNYAILTGDFNIDFTRPNPNKYGYDLLMQNFQEDCKYPTHKQGNKSPYVKYDYVFYKGLTLQQCQVITPNKEFKFDHYPKLVVLD